MIASLSPFPSLPIHGATASQRVLKICIASFDFVGPVRNGGVGTAFTSLAEAMAAAGHQVTLLFLAGRWCENQTLEHWINHYRTRGITFVPLPENGLRIDSRWHVARAYEGYLWLRQQQFDVVHFSEWKGTGYFALLAKQQGLAFANTELCIHTHGPTLWHKLSNGEFVTQADEMELDYLERRSVEMADVVVSPSQYLLSWMTEREWVLPPRCFVQQYVRPGTARQPRPNADRVHDINELVFFGRLEVRKGLVLFCDALDQLASAPELKRTTIAFLGKADKIDGRDSTEYLKQRAQRWPWKWQVLSDRDQAGAMDYLQGSGRLAIIPSLVDNLPNTVLECLGAQVPFLASNAGGIPEMIHAQDTQVVCFPLRVPALAAKLREALLAGVRPARAAIGSVETERAWIDWHAALPRLLPPAARPMPLPLVSVCISHWNRPHYLVQALASIEQQTYPNLEVVLVDDGSSSPDALELILRLEREFPARGWQLLRHSENRYPGAARNLAAAHARGEFLLFMDDDNCAKPNAIETFVSVAQRTGNDILTCCLDTFSGSSAPGPATKPNARLLFIGDDLATGIVRNNFGDTNSLWRRSVFLDVGGFHEDWGVGYEDWEIFAKAVLKGHQLQTIPEPLAWYRLNEQEATVNRKTPRHANLSAAVRPYLNAVPRSLRNLIHYAQGAVFRRGQAEDSASSRRYIELTVAWRSKLEAADLLAGRGQEKVAAQVLLEAVRAVESCGHPSVILEALLEVSPALSKFDPARAGYLLGIASTLATRLGSTAAHEKARELLDNLKRSASGPDASRRPQVTFATPTVSLGVGRRVRS